MVHVTLKSGYMLEVNKKYFMEVMMTGFKRDVLTYKYL